MKRLAIFLLPLIVLAVGVFIMMTLLKTAPETKRVAKPAAKPLVEIKTLERQDYQILLRSQGTVEPRTQSNLVSEVRGKVTRISSSFVEGGFFKKGDTLLTLDDQDYRAALAVAQADLAQAEIALTQERARAAQAQRDWERLGGGGEANELVTRKAFVDSAKASVAAAKARLKQANIDLKRTRITAPYDGRILQKSVDVGQFVNVGTTLASVFAVDFAEIKLPLTDSAFQRLQKTQSDASGFATTAKLYAHSKEWDARIVRMAGTVDTQSRQKSIIAQIDDPYGLNNNNKVPLEVGSFVDATLAGERLQGVFVIPSSAVREGRFVLIEEDKKLKRIAINPIWSSQNEVVVDSELEAGMRLITTPLSYAVDGMSLKVAGEE